MELEKSVLSKVNTLNASSSRFDGYNLNQRKIYLKVQKNF